MALPQPENTEIDHATLDSGVHIRDTERSPATGGQIAVAGLLVAIILVVFFYGLTSQRVEVAGVPPSHSDVAAPLGAGQQTPNAGTAKANAPAPAVNKAPAPMTTGSAPKR
jgi:hypothetical protein